MSTTAHPVQQDASALDAMIAAIGIELEAVERQNRADIITVHDGKRIAEDGPGATYEFECATDRIRQDDDRVVGDFDGARVHGYIVSRAKRTLTVALEADLGPTIPHGRLLVDRTWLWTTLRHRLEQLRTAPAVNLRNVDVLTGRVAPSRAADQLSVPVPSDTGLNAEQQDAFVQALTSDVSYLWGPPGTGKTVVCERIVADGFYASGKSTLIVAPTNRAVDLLLDRVIRRLEQQGQLTAALAAGHIIRVGSISDPALVRAHGAAISLDAIVSARVSALADEGGRATGDPREERAERAAETAAIREQVLARAMIVATTATRAYLPGQVERKFDSVVLDEAGFTNLPAACCAAARASRHVVLAGDFRQLGPVVASDHPRVADWIARDVYHASGVVDAIDRHGRAEGLVALRVQHRSDPSIAALANAVTYGRAPLVTHGSVLTRPPLPSPWGASALMLVDTSAIRSFVLKADRGESRYNPVHLAITRWVVTELAACGGVPRQPGDPDGVVILTPFREQLRRLRRSLPPELFRQSFDASTVHRFQGDEEGTVVLDLVDARGLPRLSRLLRATTLSEPASRLVNVGATRARRRLIVVADVRHLLRETRRGPVHEFARYLRLHAERIELPEEHVRSALTYVDRWERTRG